MNFDEIFEAYYTIYQMETDTPASTEDEYIIALRLANEAVNRWDNYDGTYWKELFTTRISSGDGTGTISTGVVDYDCPDDFKEAGGLVKLYDSNNALQQTYKILEPQEVQFQSEQATYAYFTGNPGEGHILHLNPAPTSNMDGWTIDYTYYKTATRFESGSDTTEMADPYFVVHRALANRFRGSRNPYYTSAKKDAEDVLKTMQLQNNSGSWANPWKLADNSGSSWGA